MRALVVPALAIALAAASSLGAQPAPATKAAPPATDAAAGLRPAGAGCAAPSHTTVARELIVLVGAENQVKQSMDAMVDAQLRNAPPIMAQHFGDIMREYLAEQMRWQDLEPEFIRLYCEIFTEPELKEMIAFNRTPLGQKIVRSTPELMRRAMAVGEARVQANMPVLQKRIEERLAKLKADGKLPE